MSALCGIVREGLHDYLADALPAPQRRILREHLAVCEICRGEAASRDASLVFARAFETDAPASETEAILASVRTGVAHIEAERRVAAGRRSRRPAAAAAVAAAAALLAVAVPGALSRRAPPPTAVAAVAPVPTEAPAPVPSVPDVAAEPAALPGTGTLPASATVYDLNPGAGREEPRVVWIVDRGLDI
ncbi:MAG TPA: zf-HC2 domain-containing protein [Thermoanaerobaculia bacterium]|nr:zf-HC2 domain-containing protein [Thermoanaerobaculia bacterium]